jgi:predicted N-formylglutamate amidohydrolase
MSGRGEMGADDATDQDVLLGPGDPPPVRVQNRLGQGLFLFTGDHAGNRVPCRLADLGLPQAQLCRHIAVDFGVREVGRLLSRRYDSPFIEQRYSRLVIDCNRDPGHPASIAAVSDAVPVPGNRALSRNAAEARRREVFAPYHSAVARSLARRRARGLPTVFVALHSFTPVLAGEPRPWDIGVLHEGGDSTFALAVLEALEAERGWRIGDNRPYALDATDYSVPHHAYGTGLPYVEIEVSHACLTGAARIKAVARLLGAALIQAAEHHFAA